MPIWWPNWPPTALKPLIEWIVERTGIRARHFAAPDVCSSDLALEAARQALEAAGRHAQDIDLIIVATSTPDMVFPVDCLHPAEQAGGQRLPGVRRAGGVQRLCLCADAWPMP